MGKKPENKIGLIEEWIEEEDDLFDDDDPFDDDELLGIWDDFEVED